MDKRQILVVEDEAIVGRDVQLTLQGLGYHVPVVVATGADAIQKTAENRPDLVLMDIILRGPMDGIEAAQVIRSQFGTPVVFLTGHTDPATLDRAKVAEPLAYIVKPFDDRDVQSALEIAFHKHEIQEKLRSSETLYRSVVEGSMQGISIHQDNVIQYANTAYARIFGFATPEEVVGRAALSVVAPEDAPALQSRAKMVLRGETVPLHPGWQGIRKDGQRIWLESTINLISWNGRAAVLSFVIDITERKRLEAQFQQAQKMEAIGHLAGGVAHDFNNLITVISGFSEILLNAMADDNPMRTPLREIRRAGDRAASLTRQLLAFSRKQILAPVVLDADTVVIDMEKMLRRLIGEDIGLVRTLGARRGAIRADPGQLEQALLNLAVNSRDAMPTGGVLTIATRSVVLNSEFHPEVKPGPYVVFSVSDTGCGMDEQTLAHIFEPFFTTKEPGKGTGLGLAMVYGFIKQSEGHIDVTSKKGQGTTFQLYLPRVAAAPPSGGSHPGFNVPRGTEVVLLVEDEASVRKLARMALETHGYTVLEAEDGEAALRFVAQHSGRIDLVVSDVVMPRLGGRQLVDRLQTFRPGLKALYLSGYMDDTVLRHGVVDHHVAFLAKPFTPSVLAAKAREVLDQRDPELGGTMTFNAPG